MPILYTDKPSFEEATVLCTDPQLTQYAPSGNYSINGKYRYWFVYSTTRKFVGKTFKCS
jgi:hypothetical protein